MGKFSEVGCEEGAYIEWSEGKIHSRVIPELGQLHIPAAEEFWHNLLAAQRALWDHKELQDAFLSATPMFAALFWALKVEMVPEENLLPFTCL